MTEHHAVPSHSHLPTSYNYASSPCVPPCHPTTHTARAYMIGISNRLECRPFIQMKLKLKLNNDSATVKLSMLLTELVRQVYSSTNLPLNLTSR